MAVEEDNIAKSTEQSIAPKLNTAEKVVAEFLDAYIDGLPAKMRAVMTESFQTSYDFTPLTDAGSDKLTPLSFRLLSYSKVAGSSNVVVELLLQDAKSGKQKIEQREYNLIPDSDSGKLLISSEKNTKSNKPWYKKPLFWVLAILGILIIVGSIFFLLQSRKTTQNQSTINSAWNEITTEAKLVNDLGEKATKNKDDYANYSKQLQNMSTLVDSKRQLAGQMSGSGTDSKDVTNYKSALNNLSEYISEASSQSSAIDTFSTADANKLNELSIAAQDAINTFQNNAKFLQSSMPSDIYNIADTLSSAKDRLDEVKANEQSAKDAAAAVAKKDAADKAASTASINTFQNGFIAGNAATMRPVMTTGFQGEYNFNQLAPSEREFQYPSSFRVISVTKQPDGTYKAQVNVLYKYTDNPNQFTQGFEYSLISQSNKWLINNEKVGNSF